MSDPYPAVDRRSPPAASRGGPVGAPRPLRPVLGSTEAGGDGFEFTRDDFERVRTLIRARAGIALAPSKSNMVYSRLSRRLRELRMTRFRDYLDALESGRHADWQGFVNALTTNLTKFFREDHHFPVLARHLAAWPRNGEIRLWCSAASTGEEAYSIAIVACEAFASLAPPVRILATDIDTEVLAEAERGIYAEERVATVSEARLRRYFPRGSGVRDGQVRVRPELRRLVEFRPLNLLAPSWPIAPGLAAIFCRNVMIYFDRPTQLAVLRRFRPLLAPGALLFAGHSESFGGAGDWLQLRGQTVYQHAGDAAA